jgi:hypothetical protein
MTIALRDDRGLVFATLSKLSERHMMVESDAAYDRGHLLEFQFTPEARRASVQGQAVVLRVEPATVAGGPASYALRIVELASGSAPLYREWLRDLAHGGGSSSRPHHHHASSITSSVTSASSRRAEGEQRLAALDERRRKGPSSVVSSIVGSSTTDARAGHGRKAMRQALRGFAVRRSGGDANGRLPVEPVLDQVVPRRRDHARPVAATPSEISGVGGRQHRRPGLEISVSDHTDPPRVEVRFNEPRSFLAMFRQHLDRDVLFLRYDGPELRVDGRARVRMVLPTDDVVLCDAHVGANLPSGTGFLLHMTEQERELLRSVYGRIRRQSRR